MLQSHHVNVKQSKPTAHSPILSSLSCFVLHYFGFLGMLDSVLNCRALVDTSFYHFPWYRFDKLEDLPPDYLGGLRPVTQREVIQHIEFLDLDSTHSC
jgi:hypothetical protein